MMNRLRIALGMLLFSLASPFGGTAQEAIRFHADLKSFIQEARDYMGVRKPEETQSALKAIENAVNTGQLEENHLIDLAKKANRLDKLKARPVPDFLLFLQAYSTLGSGNNAKENYWKWSQWADKLLEAEDKNLNRFNVFLTFTLDFLEQGILVRTSGMSWKVTKQAALFEIDSSFCINLRGVSLINKTGQDSTMIHDTGGKFYPSNGLWAGESGSITWVELGIPADQVYVRLNKYKLDLSRSVYAIDSANLIDKRYFSDPVIGRVENKVQPGIPPDQAGYPRFTSYELKNRIKNLYPGMDYEGGYSLQGRKVLGIGLNGMKGQLIVFEKGTPRFRLASTYFLFQPDQARGINTEASIYLETDSIYHPGLLFQYNLRRNELALIRDGQGLSPSRYFDSYHDFDFNVEMVRWNPGDSLIYLSSMVGSIENKASFESADFFSIQRYNEILIEDKRHPVAAVKQCAEYFHSRFYTLHDLADFMNRSENMVEEMLLRLSFLGFVRYNTDTKLVEVSERAYDFLKKNAGNQDYDIIRFTSATKPPASNATLNLNSGKLSVKFVNSIELSTARNIIIYPDNQTVEILKDRNILFDGRVEGSYVTCLGKQMRFVYDDFCVKMDSLDQIRLRVFEEPAEKGKPGKVVDVTSIIENTTAKLWIDNPNNKSGYFAADLPEYPMLQTDSNAYVYYDQKEILNGIYPRETFNFTLNPFLLKGLNLKTLADSLDFPGRFMTADIFPPIDLELKHQKDHSLGFQTLKTPEEGYPVYKGKGFFYNTMAMSRAGLRGSGRLEYLNSAVESNDILFLPDQVITMANTFAVNSDTTASGNPETVGQEMAIKWSPQKDQLIATGKNNPLDLYGKVQFDGDLNLEPDGLTGKGTIRFDKFSITSQKFKFYQQSFDAGDSELNIYEKLISRHMDGTVSIQDSMAVFKPSAREAVVEFTRNQMRGTPASFTWNMAEARITMDSTRFRMARNEADRLEIPSVSSEYLLNANVIKASQVEFLNVADVRIFPADRNVNIREAASIDSLRQAVIVSRDSTLVHRIAGASVKIVDDKEYHASGNYQYKDVAGREFPVRFSDIRPDANGISSGKGEIMMESDFSLSPAFDYYGGVEWNNNERFLKFTGYTQINHACNENKKNWIAFTERIDPDSVSIPVDSITVNDQNERLFKGFYLSNQPVELYSTFIGPHLRYSDQPLITSWGRLWFDQALGNYFLTSAEKQKKPDTDGPLMTFNPDKCEIEATGKLETGIDLGQVRLGSAGSLVHDLRKDSLYGQVILTTDFYLDSKLLDYMASSINKASGTEPVNYASPGFRKAFRAYTGKARADELLGQLGMLGRWRKVPDELLHTISFTDLQFKWNPETGSYQSVGKIGIGNILEEPVNKKVNGHLEIVHRRGGDSFTMYLEIDRQSYFFLTYSRGVMQCLAGPKFEKFNNLIRDAKESKRILETKPGEPTYQYYLGQYRQVQEFLSRFGVER